MLTANKDRRCVESIIKYACQIANCIVSACVCACARASLYMCLYELAVLQGRGGREEDRWW
jgi:hypothetical protein